LLITHNTTDGTPSDRAKKILELVPRSDWLKHITPVTDSDDVPIARLLATSKYALDHRQLRANIGATLKKVFHTPLDYDKQHPLMRSFLYCKRGVFWSPLLRVFVSRDPSAARSIAYQAVCIAGEERVVYITLKYGQKTYTLGALVYSPLVAAAAAAGHDIGNFRKWQFGEVKRRLVYAILQACGGNDATLQRFAGLRAEWTLRATTTIDGEGRQEASGAHEVRAVHKELLQRIADEAVVAKRKRAAAAAAKKAAKKAMVGEQQLLAKLLPQHEPAPKPTDKPPPRRSTRVRQRRADYDDYDWGTDDGADDGAGRPKRQRRQHGNSGGATAARARVPGDGGGELAARTARRRQQQERRQRGGGRAAQASTKAAGASASATVAAKPRVSKRAKTAHAHRPASTTAARAPKQASRQTARAHRPASTTVARAPASKRARHARRQSVHEGDDDNIERADGGGGGDGGTMTATARDGDDNDRGMAKRSADDDDNEVCDARGDRLVLIYVGNSSVVQCSYLLCHADERGGGGQRQVTCASGDNRVGQCHGAVCCMDVGPVDATNCTSYMRVCNLPANCARVPRCGTISQFRVRSERAALHQRCSSLCRPAPDHWAGRVCSGAMRVCRCCVNSMLLTRSLLAHTHDTAVCWLSAASSSSCGISAALSSSPSPIARTISAFHFSLRMRFFFLAHHSRCLLCLSEHTCPAQWSVRRGSAKRTTPLV